MCNLLKWNGQSKSQARMEARPNQYACQYRLRESI